MIVATPKNICDCPALLSPQKEFFSLTLLAAPIRSRRLISGLFVTMFGRKSVQTLALGGRGNLGTFCRQRLVARRAGVGIQLVEIADGDGGQRATARRRVRFARAGRHEAAERSHPVLGSRRRCRRCAANFAAGKRLVHVLRPAKLQTHDNTIHNVLTAINQQSGHINPRSVW